jgi:hypothetical protein
LRLVEGSVGGGMALMLRLRSAGRSQVRFSRQPSTRASAHEELSPAAVTLFAVGQIVRLHPASGFSHTLRSRKNRASGVPEERIPKSPLRFLSWLVPEHRGLHPRRPLLKKSRFAFFHKGRSLPLFVCAALFSPLQKKFAWLREADVPPGNVPEPRNISSTNQLQPCHTQQHFHCSAVMAQQPQALPLA